MCAMFCSSASGPCPASNQWMAVPGKKGEPRLRRRRTNPDKPFLKSSQAFKALFEFCSQCWPTWAMNLTPSPQRFHHTGHELPPLVAFQRLGRVLILPLLPLTDLDACTLHSSL